MDRDEIAERGDTVVVAYLAMTKEGEVVSRADEKRPLTFVLGSGRLIRGFEEAVEGMRRGETRRVEVPPEKGFSGNHPLAGKTLVFEITLLEVHKRYYDVRVSV
ncbi:MAG: FKBP-type peptidyl-prolyl cis-trans isomerase [Euryarchaeota archaeon]|nr:FKBP-type peptidyl-prolyl cis-trans isomerase [Euryarchaeota archaeon]